MSPVQPGIRESDGAYDEGYSLVLCEERVQRDPK